MPNSVTLLRILAFYGAMLFSPSYSFAVSIDSKQISEIVLAEQPNIDQLRELGPGVLPVMADLYENSDEKARASIAWVFYTLGWKSADAERVLMRDAHTDNATLRLQVQWALGRVSDAPEVVDVLLENMKYDQNELFRDKAACALANDQIHLNEEQKVRLFEGLIGGLESDNPQVRNISILALEIHTGQRKGFDPNATDTERADKIMEWRQWLDNYRASL